MYVRIPFTLAILIQSIAFYMKKLLLSISFITFLAFAGTAFADTGVYGGYGAPCQPIYGGGETCVSNANISINKTVQNPTTKAYVDNLSLSNDPKYSPNQKVEFKLTISNTGDKTLDEVKVIDTFPSFLAFSNGAGTYDNKTKQLTFKIFNLKPNESKTYNVEAKVTANLPTDQAVNCVVNQAQAISGSNQSSDIAQVCIEKVVATTKGGLPVMSPPSMTQTPATGPEMLSLLAMIPTALAGFYLRKRSK